VQQFARHVSLVKNPRVLPLKTILVYPLQKTCARSSQADLTHDVVTNHPCLGEIEPQFCPGFQEKVGRWLGQSLVAIAGQHRLPACGGGVVDRIRNGTLCRQQAGHLVVHTVDDPGGWTFPQRG